MCHEKHARIGVIREEMRPSTSGRYVRLAFHHETGDQKRIQAGDQSCAREPRAREQFLPCQPMAAAHQREQVPNRTRSPFGDPRH